MAFSEGSVKSYRGLSSSVGTSRIFVTVRTSLKIASVFSLLQGKDIAEESENMCICNCHFRSFSFKKNLRIIYRIYF